MQKDWAVQIAPPGSGTALGVFPAEYGASFTSASCSDFVVFPVNASGSNGSSKQANVVGFSNLYKTTCSGTNPSVQFAYYVGTGKVQTSPVLSEDGTKLAFVESKSGASVLHVLTIGTTGSNGSAYNAPAIPGTGNNASDVALTLHGGVSVTLSSPFVDYSGDIAYVGDDSGNVHKFTGVFRGTLAEVASGGWPFNTSTSTLTGPVLDGTSKHIFIGSGGGFIHCIDVSGTTPAACSTPDVIVANGTVSSGAVLDAPMVDSTAGKIYSEAQATDSCTGRFCTQPTFSVLMQADTNLANVVRVNVGQGGTNLHNGDFDNTYYSSTSGTGNMYFCGNQNSSSTAQLYQIPITNGTVTGTANAGSLLVRQGNTFDCSPLTEVFNGTTDELFVGVRGEGESGGTTTGCKHQACIMSFNLSTWTTGEGPGNAFALGGNSIGPSGIIVDNISSQTGASQIYFSNLQSGAATQVSQSALQ
jgi:hypothetical protein